MAGVTLAATDVQLRVRADRPVHRISPHLYGLFFEDINFAADAGLYAELVQNRSFEFENGMYGWTKVERGGGKVDFSWGTERPLHANNPRHLRLRVAQAGLGVGVANSGFGGIPVRRGQRFRLSMFARTVEGGAAGFEVRLETPEGAVLGRCSVEGVGRDWREVTGQIKADAGATNARLVVLRWLPGTVDLDMVSLFPADTWKGRSNGLRADLVQKMLDLKPSFFRFPGGCIIEGKNLDNAYRWKDTVGAPWERRQNWNLWDASGKAHPPYYQSYGLGFYEYFVLCEDLRTEPMPVVNCGMSCQFRGNEHVPLDQLEPYIQDALDLIEFANGPATSRWGGLRASMGHPAPFRMRYLGVGNEQWGEPYLVRFERFQKALKARHPEIVLIATPGPFPDGPDFDLGWRRLSEMKAEILDEHYYRDPLWFYENTGRYDRYDRNGPKVFVGEYASHTGMSLNASSRPNLAAALSEAAHLTALERNSDVVVMAAYAPLFGKLGGFTWPVNLILFDGQKAFGTPSYYVQQMFSQHRGDVVLPTEVVDPEAARAAAGRIGLFTYHTAAEFKDLQVVQDGQVLYAPAFQEKTRDWRTFQGRWETEEGVYRQPNAEIITWSLAGDRAWTNYTLSVKGRKLEGKEGFILIVREYAHGCRLEWNLGGWDNTKHGFQVLRHGQATLVEDKPGRIETNRWYSLRVELRGARVRCYLDEVLMHDLDVPQPPLPRLFATSSREEKTGRVLLKVVNRDDEPVEARIALEGVRRVGRTAQVLVLQGEPEDENSLEQPEKIKPVAGRVKISSPEFRHAFPASSVTFLTLEAANIRH